MAKTFHLTIARIGENLFDGDAEMVTLPGVDGVFTVLANHEALVSPLKEGEARIKDAAGQIHLIHVADKSIAEVSNNQATVLF